MSVGFEGAQRRRRRTPEAAQREIIEAAEALLRERPFRELTVDDVMRQTGLSRPSFYVYFRDRHELVLRVVEHLFTQIAPAAAVWLESEGPGRLREAIERVTEMYVEHGAVLRALADAATDDPEVERAYGQLMESFIGLVEKQIASEVAAGRMDIGDPREMATAIVWMFERYLYVRLRPGERSRVATVSETFYIVALRIMYGTVDERVFAAPPAGTPAA